MENNFQSIQYFLPELILILTILFVIVCDLIPSVSRYSFNLTLFGLLFMGLMMFINGPSGEYIFNKMLIDDMFSFYFNSIILLSTFSIIVVSRYSKELNDEYRIEYNVLLLVVLLGMFLMTSSINLVMIYLSLELVSIPSYILAGMLKSDKKSNEAALKYVIFGSFSSGLMLIGFSWLYGLSGSTNIYEVYSALSLLDNQSAVLLSILFILVGFGYKVSMVPFHYWTPDVYEGSPITVTAFLSAAPKAAGFALFIRTFFVLFSDSGTFLGSSPILDINWPLLLAILSGATMTIGNLLALRQDNVKRMLAYSTISHVGFMLMALCAMNVEAIAGIMFYLLMYSFMNLSAFYMVLFASNKLNAVNVDDWNGLAFRTPILSAFMVISLVSLAGLPPTSGFIGKVYLFRSLFYDKEFFWLAIVGILNSVVSLYYYFRIVKAMYFKKSEETSMINAHPVIYWSIILLSSQNLIFYLYWSDLYEFLLSIF
tara:strand:+ start:1209 stop:2660 length:1452 start_codon:yes stop_codon:yes gene_type:complete